MHVINTTKYEYTVQEAPFLPDEPGRGIPIRYREGVSQGLLLRKLQDLSICERNLKI